MKLNPDLGNNSYKVLESYDNKAIDQNPQLFMEGKTSDDVFKVRAVLYLGLSRFVPEQHVVQ